MPTSLPLRSHLALLRRSGESLARHARQAGLAAAVPSCPSWDVAALLAHQTMVHRWATAQVNGTDPGQVPNQTAIRADVADLFGYYEEGLAGVIAALSSAPDDLKAMTFLNDAPSPRRFWARRQAHETTVHAIDAHAARLGRLPTAAESGITTATAVDGLDELLRGFFTRGRSKLFDGVGYTMVVTPDDADQTWIVRVDERLTVDAPGSEVPDDAEVTLAGSAVALYLGLWNRGDEIRATGDPALLARWHATQRVRWS